MLIGKVTQTSKGTGLRDRLESLGSLPEDKRRSVVSAVGMGFRENFETESAGGTPWQQLARSTVYERITLGFPGEHPILVRTGRYMRTWVDSSDPLNRAEWTTNAGGVELSVTSNDPRKGALSGDDVNVPARHVHILSDNAINVLGGVIESVVKKVVLR